jgi:hypothetical protein
VEKRRSREGRRIKLCHISEIKLMIVQIPGAPHDFFIGAFNKALFAKLGKMASSEIWETRSSLIEWPTDSGSSSKEGDNGYVNRNLRDLLDLSSSWRLGPVNP